MSGIDRIRRQALDIAAGSGGSIGEEEIEALCDVAVAARSVSRHLEHTDHHGCAYLPGVVKHLDRALARLDAEASP